MELRLTPELQAKVERAAAENNSDAEGNLQQLVEHYLEYDQCFRQQVQKGLDQLDRGEYLGTKKYGPASRKCSARKWKFAGRPSLLKIFRAS